jgi:hypothetical protein
MCFFTSHSLFSIYGITLLPLIFFSVPIIELNGYAFKVDEGKSVSIECKIIYEEKYCPPFWERINEDDEKNYLSQQSDVLFHFSQSLFH